MAKGKAAKSSSTSANKPAFSRVQFLHQAAALLVEQRPTPPVSAPQQADSNGEQCLLPKALARSLIADVQAVSRKTQIRLPTTMKHTICKSCNSILTEGITCERRLENKSKTGRKPWADVVVQTCYTCGFVKRFPVGAQRQKRRSLRKDEKEMDKVEVITEQDIGD